jgi:alanine racemase
MNERTWVEISTAAFNHNIAQIQQLTNMSNLAMVIKSNAYGHGLLPLATLAEGNPAISLLCTAHGDEALALRHAGIKKQILNLVHWSTDNIDDLIQHKITLTIVTQHTALQVIEAAQRCNKEVAVHIKVDSGLGRLGVFAREAEQVIKILDHPLIKIEGIFSHLSDKDGLDQEYTKQQIDIFNTIIAYLADKNITFTHQHILSSGALEFASLYKHSLIRPGTNVYGFWSSSLSRDRAQSAMPGLFLQPLMTWKTRIMQLKNLATNISVGYARTYITARPTRIAVLPIGYSDGYPRALSNKAHVFIHNCLVPVIGMVSMNLIVVDVTDIPHVAVGDEVVLMGATYGVTATELASLIGTITIELTTGINHSIPRVIVP